ncbi:MAG TPA: hypothetical protein VK158_00475 [Acidobacteriota bacterium]|nr:hypothetical protein [Acidobacteriota bacterium]
MKHVCTREHKGFQTDFYVLEKTDRYLLAKGVNLADHILDDFQWHEHILFEMLNPSLDPSWDEQTETRKKFDVYYYGVIESWLGGKPLGFEDAIDVGDKTSLSDSFFAISLKDQSRIGIKCKIIVR